MGAGASAKEAPLESSDPEEQAVYARLKARYDGESPALGSDVGRTPTLSKSPKRETVGDPSNSRSVENPSDSTNSIHEIVSDIRFI
jgi:hypothetical protein